MSESPATPTHHGTLSGDLGRPRAELVFVGILFLLVRLALELGGVPLATPLATATALVAIAVLATRGLAIPLGLDRPASWLRAVFSGLVVLAASVVILLVLGPAIELGRPSEPLLDSGFVRGDPVALGIGLVLVVWIAGAFAEEVLWRGFVLPRLAAILGDSPPAWIGAVLLQAALFGLLHASSSGPVTMAAIGAVAGLSFWLGGRNLWPLVVARAIPGTVELLDRF